MRLSAQSSRVYTWVSTCAGSEQLVQVDVRYGLSPVTERAELWQNKGLVLLFAQQREHVLHQLTEPAVAAEITENRMNDPRENMNYEA